MAPQMLLARPPEPVPPSDRLPAVWWLWLPLALLVFFSASSLLAPVWYEAEINHENGGMELLQASVLLIAFLVAVISLPLARARGPRWMFAWIALASVCCFYVLGEELSWGQHLLGWSTPEGWAAINDQNETNLHNASSWLDQKPRLLLGIGVGVGGILVPLYALWRPQIRAGRLGPFLPPLICLPMAVIAIGVGVVWTLDGFYSGRSLFIRPSEVQEIFFYLFVLLYLVVLRRRLLARPPQGVLT